MCRQMFDVVTLAVRRRAVKAIYKETFYLIRPTTPGDPGITGSLPAAFSGTQRHRARSTARCPRRSAAPNVTAPGPRPVPEYQFRYVRMWRNSDSAFGRAWHGQWAAVALL